MTTLLDGKKVAAEVRIRVAADVAALRERGTVPALAVVLATGDEAAAWYAGSIENAAGKAGILVRLVDLGADADQAALGRALAGLAADRAVHGIILQTPLPAGVDRDALVSAIPFVKDVDGVSPLSAGRLMSGLPAFAPATAAAVMELLDAHDVPLRGARAVVAGRSMVVGKPVAQLLLARDATVTICHSRTRDLPAVTREADVLVAAIGRPRFFGGEHVKPGAIVVDVGTTPDETGKITGDVDAGSVQGIAGALSPVPGGVGPVTTALLLLNTVQAAGRRLPGA
jgi:methylenetetrahydrofolate dehydrogenase (NADP+) / methenyltetrahydrofolate cyclohydrolase